MSIKKIIVILLLPVMAISKSFSQDTTDIMRRLEKEYQKASAEKTEYVTATFKTTRLIDGHSTETTGSHVLDLRISHRFGTVNGGAYNFFGLDNATMRLGFDYGINDRLMVGIGRSTYEKIFDGFFKYKILRQSTGKHKMPITLDYVPTIALKTIEWFNPNSNKYLASRTFFTHQLIIGRKFSENTSLQLMPTFIRGNRLTPIPDPNDILAIGIGGRQKISKRVSFNVEYYYQLPGYKLEGSTNALSVGFDIETGGHVFQLHFTNSTGMTERSFIAENTGTWGKGEILFGFNLSRVFNVGGKKYHPW